MKKILKLTIIFVLILFTACSQKEVEPLTKVLSPKTLKADESLVVNFSSRGCFSHSSNVFVFKREKVTIYDTSSQWNKKEAEKKTLGTLILTIEDKERLENLFRYYEGKLKKGCTTVNIIEMKHYKATKLLSSRVVIDGSCELNQSKNRANFDEFVKRVKAVVISSRDK